MGKQLDLFNPNFPATYACADPVGGMVRGCCGACHDMGQGFLRDDDKYYCCFQPDIYDVSNGPYDMDTGEKKG